MAKRSKSSYEKNPLAPTQSSKTTTSCPSWFFGGPHQWDNLMADCKKRRKAEMGYGTWWTVSHEWADKKGGVTGGACIHCGLTRKELKPKPSPQDKCTGCGATRAETLRQAQQGVQPELHCEEFGHVVKRGRLQPGKPRLAELIGKVVDLDAERTKRRKQ